MKFFKSIFLALAFTAGSSIAINIQAQTETGYFLHTVTKGQSLYSISSMYNVTISEIVRLNPGSDKQIREGSALKIPQSVDSNSNKPIFHTIQSGETLYRLSAKYNVTTQAICKANPGLSSENFRSGQVIAIPAQSASNSNTPIADNKAEEGNEQISTDKKNEWKDMHKVARKETILKKALSYLFHTARMSSRSLQSRKCPNLQKNRIFLMKRFSAKMKKSLKNTIPSMLLSCFHL